MRSTVKTIVSWVVLLVSAMLLYNVFTTPPKSTVRELSFSGFLNAVDNKNVRKASIDDSDLTGEFISGGYFRTVVPSDYPALYDRLQGVDLRIEHRSSTTWTTVLVWWAPVFLFAGIMIFFARQWMRLTLQKKASTELHSGETTMVQLEPDVAKAFTNPLAVNEALRLVIQLKEIRGTA